MLTSLILRLASPEPRDTRVIRQLPRYRGLDPRWHHWDDVVSACGDIALALTDGDS